MSPVASIIIPTYNHAQYLREAVDSALAQTCPVEVLVVDDGSTDGTRSVLDSYRDIRVIRTEHLGPCNARNVGLDNATAEFVMFLDADDVIEPDKVAIQLQHMSDEVGWVMCDVRIEDETHGTFLASERYSYERKEIGGWIRDKLVGANFIPIMSPLIRRSVLDGVRFHDHQVPEDWHFWVEVAGRARVRYVNEVLATYRHRRTGRSRLPKAARKVDPNLEMPLRLNLGCGSPDALSWHPLKGLVNLDKSLGWRFEDGLGDFVAESVAGITVSHALMYVKLEDWPFVFSEFHRVLQPGGILRITEDDAYNPQSSRCGGWKGSESAVTLIDAQVARKYLRMVGFEVFDVDAQTTHYVDNSLCQRFHGDPPHVFFIEGKKHKVVFFAPHNDDETLFGAFTIARYRLRVVVCYASSGDYGDPVARETETRAAMNVLGAAAVEQWHGGDIAAQMRELDAREKPTLVFAPSLRTSHPEHAQVGQAAREVFGSRVTTYHTYDEQGKVFGTLVAFEQEWIAKKLRALACYMTQLTHPRAVKFFLDDLYEYLE